MKQSPWASLCVVLMLVSPLWGPLCIALPYLYPWHFLASAVFVAGIFLMRKRRVKLPTAKLVDYQGHTVSGCPRCSGVQLGIKQWNCEACGKNYQGIPSGDVLACPRCSSLTVRARIATCKG